MLHHLISRLTKSALVDDIIVATGPGSENDVIRDDVLRSGFDCPYVRRDEDDVLGRYVDAARLYQGDVIVRVTGDCPLIDADIVDTVIKSLGEKEFSSNAIERTYPRGLDVEVMPMRVLEWLHEKLSWNHPGREHVCSYVYKSDEISKVSVTDTEDNSDLVWCVDDVDDFNRVGEMLSWGILPYSQLLRRVRDGR